MAEPLIQAVQGIPTPYLIACGVGGIGAVWALAKMTWSWMMKLVERFQEEAAQARKDFVAETGAARKEFLQGLKDLEEQRQLSEQRVHDSLNSLKDTMTGIHEILRERGIPGPTVTTLTTAKV